MVFRASSVRQRDMDIMARHEKENKLNIFHLRFLEHIKRQTVGSPYGWSPVYVHSLFPPFFPLHPQTSLVWPCPPNGRQSDAKKHTIRGTSINKDKVSLLLSYLRYASRYLSEVCKICKQSKWSNGPTCRNTQQIATDRNLKEGEKNCKRKAMKTYVLEGSVLPMP